jgi:hypothetical protein
LFDYIEISSSVVNAQKKHKKLGNSQRSQRGKWGLGNRILSVGGHLIFRYSQQPPISFFYRVFVLSALILTLVFGAFPSFFF